jgi:hypothetical protein
MCRFEATISQNIAIATSDIERAMEQIGCHGARPRNQFFGSCKGAQ